MTSAAAIAVRGAVKRYGGELALAGVDFDVVPGEIHALLGENGAGKSTLIKALAGVVELDEGDIATGGELAFVHQDLGLCENLSVAENLALATGYERASTRLISFRATERVAAARLRELGVRVSPQALVRDLAQDERVMVAVARAFALDARTIVLDEVGSSLPAPEVARLAQALRVARDAGVAFVYVTHRLEEIFGLADRSTVLRDGKRVITAPVAEVTHEDVVGSILGRAVATEAPGSATARAPVSADVRLRVAGLSADGIAEPLSFDVAAGETLALCGLVGCGARSVAEVLGGARAAAAGTVTVCHRHTRDLADHCRAADVLVVAVGSQRLVREDWIRPGATVIDVGINRTADGLVGDVDFEAARHVAGAITPVPGGVGPMTIACLLRNTVDARRTLTSDRGFARWVL